MQTWKESKIPTTSKSSILSIKPKHRFFERFCKTFCGQVIIEEKNIVGSSNIDNVWLALNVCRCTSVRPDGYIVLQYLAI